VAHEEAQRLLLVLAQETRQGPGLWRKLGDDGLRRAAYRGG
jgi:hypothetical protein